LWGLRIGNRGVEGAFEVARAFGVDEGGDGFARRRVDFAVDVCRHSVLRSGGEYMRTYDSDTVLILALEALCEFLWGNLFLESQL
jgi:hypothetical protein